MRPTRSFIPLIAALMLPAGAFAQVQGFGDNTPGAFEDRADEEVDDDPESQVHPLEPFLPAPAAGWRRQGPPDVIAASPTARHIAQAYERSDGRDGSLVVSLLSAPSAGETSRSGAAARPALVSTRTIDVRGHQAELVHDAQLATGVLKLRVGRHLVVVNGVDASADAIVDQARLVDVAALSRR